MKKPSIQFVLRSAEILAAVALTFGFRSLLDRLLDSFALGNWAMLIRWLMLVLFIGAAVRLHAVLITFLKSRGIISADIW